jgi:hypothetical protein
MTTKPKVGATKHKWLLGDLDSLLLGAQSLINRLIAEIRQQQERSGRPHLGDVAMLVAELAQLISQARGLAREMTDLVEGAPDAELDDAERLAEQIAGLQRQIEEINRRLNQ